MSAMVKSKVWNHAAVAARLPALDGERYVEPFATGGTTLGLYQPLGEDPQQPHDRDEFYFVVAGSGWFEHGGERTAFAPGDALYVAAGVPHRFVEFSRDFSAWVVFWSAADEQTTGP